MTRDPFRFQDLEPDIADWILQRVVELTPGFSEAIRQQIRKEGKEKFGGKRNYSVKRAKRMTPEERQALFADGLTDMSTEDLTEKHKISRATLYRAMKQGGRFGS